MYGINISTVKMNFHHKITKVLVSALHNEYELGHANIFIESFNKFRSDLRYDWEAELALREWYNGPKPFEWSVWDEKNPHVSEEFEDNWDWCNDRANICLFIKHIYKYI